MHQLLGASEFVPCGFLIGRFGPQQDLRAHDAGQTFGDACMACNRDFYRLIDYLQSGRRITIETIGIGQVGKDTGFIL